MGKRKALGKGLNALFPDIGGVMVAGDEKGRVTVCSPQAIRPSPYQPRRFFDPEKLKELADSLRSSGILQPLVVRECPDGYELIAGERRWRAASQAGLKEVPIIVKNVPDDQVLKLSLIENLQRENLNPVEEAEGYQRLLGEFELSQENLAEIVGKDRSTITNAIRLLKLPEEIKQGLASGNITPGHARPLLSLEAASLQLQVCRQILRRKLSVRQTEALVKRNKEKDPPTAKKDDPNLKSLQEGLQRHLGTRVRIRGKGEKGRIEISFFSADDFQRILKTLLGGS